MKLAFDGRSLSARALRGWDRYTVGLVEALTDAEVEVTLLHDTNAAPRPEHVQHLSCDITAIPARGGLHWEQVALPRALRGGAFDLYHAPAEHGVPLAHPCPAILTIHSVTEHSYVALVDSGTLRGSVRDYIGYDARPRRWTVANLYWRSQVARADHILAPSEFARDEIIEHLHIAPARVTTTHLAVPRQFHQPRRSPTERLTTLDRLGVHSPYILYVGGFEPHKNIAGLVETFALVRARVPRLSLVAVGTKGVPTEMTVNGQQGVRFLADLTGELNDLYDGAELFVSMSWRETFCLPALEALARGVPVVVSSWGATPEVVGDGGRLVDPRSPRQASAVILELLEHPDRAHLAARAKSAAAKFDWARTAEVTIRVYRETLERKRKRAH